MQDQQIWTFIEVRYRATSHFGGALESVTRHKQYLLYRAATVWLLKQGLSLADVPCRFDLLAITGVPAVFEWLPNAFNFDR